MAPVLVPLSFFANIRSRATTAEKSSASVDDELAMTRKFPRSEDREADVEIGVLMMNGNWIQRRMVITKSVVAFAKTRAEARTLGEDEDTLLDAIPLHHIEAIRVLRDDEDCVKIKNRQKTRDLFMESFDGRDQLGTEEAKPDGKAPGISGADQRVNENNPPQGWNVPLKPTLSLKTELENDTLNFGADHDKSVLKRENSLLENSVVDKKSLKKKRGMSEADSEMQCLKIAEDLKGHWKICKKKYEDKSRMQKLQERVRRIYVSTPVQCGVGALILTNFGCSIVEAQLSGSLVDSNGNPTQAAVTISTLNLAFIAIFTIELAVNMFSHWFHKFITDSWCIFDFIIVAASLISLGPIPIPSSILRLLRAFRVIRLFGRIRAVKQIISALTQSIFPVMNAFLIMFVALCVYAIMGVSFFADDDPDEFERFDRSFITLFRVLAGDTWAPGLDVVDADGSIVVGNALFMFTFRLLVDWILLQVSVAVLLDKFVSATAQLESEEKRELEASHKRKERIQNPLDPFLERLTADYADDADLTLRLGHYFQEMDFDASKGISFPELCQGMKGLGFDPPIHMTQSDFAVLTHNGSLCNSKGEMTFDQFEAAIRKQMKLYTQRRMADVLKLGQASEEDSTQLAALKSVVVTQQRMEKSVDDLQRTMSAVQQTLLDIRTDQLRSSQPTARGGGGPSLPVEVVRRRSLISTRSLQSGLHGLSQMFAKQPPQASATPPMPAQDKNPTPTSTPASSGLPEGCATKNPVSDGASGRMAGTAAGVMRDALLEGAAPSSRVRLGVSARRKSSLTVRTGSARGALMRTPRATPRQPAPAAGLGGLLDSLVSLGGAWGDARPLVADWSRSDTARQLDAVTRRFMEPVACMSVRQSTARPPQ